MTIYFAEQHENGLIKIGYSTRPEQRRTSIQSSASAPVRIVATIDGGKETEQLIHHQLAESRHFGEWFKPTKQVLDFIESVKGVGFDGKPIKRDKDGSFVNEAAIEDLRIASELVTLAVGPVWSGETKTSALESRLLPKLRQINPAWTMRKLRTIQYGESTNIQLWVVRDLLAVIQENQSSDLSGAPAPLGARRHRIRSS